MVVLGKGALSYERGTPVPLQALGCGRTTVLGVSQIESRDVIWWGLVWTRQKEELRGSVGSLMAMICEGENASLGPLGCQCAQHRPTPRPSLERICRKALFSDL